MFYCEFCEISKTIIFEEHLCTTACEFITEMLIFRRSRSQMFFKVSVLKNFAILEPLSTNKPPFTEHLRWLLLNVCGSKYFFVAEYGISGPPEQGGREGGGRGGISPKKFSVDVPFKCALFEHESQQAKSQAS